MSCAFFLRGEIEEDLTQRVYSVSASDSGNGSIATGDGIVGSSWAFAAKGKDGSKPSGLTANTTEKEDRTKVSFRGVVYGDNADDETEQQRTLPSFADMKKNFPEYDMSGGKLAMECLKTVRQIMTLLLILIINFLKK